MNCVRNRENLTVSMGNFLDLPTQGFGVRMLKFYCRVPPLGFRADEIPTSLSAADIEFDFIRRPMHFQNQPAIRIV